MRRARPLLLLALCLAACSQAPAPPALLQISGVWQGFTDYGSGVRLELVQSGVSISGTFYTSSKLTPTTFRRWGPLTGVLDGSTVTLDATGDPGEYPRALTHFVGQVDGDHYNGSLTTTSGSNTDTVPFSTVRDGTAG